MDNEKLNERLAIWRGFKFVDKPRYFTGFPGAAVACYWITPDGVETPYSPNFAFDLTACFKWLVPEVYEKYGEVKTRELLEVWAWYVASGAYWGKEAKALCLAIEKLIEVENE